MSSIQQEKHRLTLLQRQVMQWLRSEGGGSLPVPVLFASALRHYPVPYTDSSQVAAKLCEAVEQLQRMGYTEVRDESRRRTTKAISLYDYAPIEERLEEINDVWIWNAPPSPVVALSDEGSFYVQQNF
jgi:hypothetical protein